MKMDELTNNIIHILENEFEVKEKTGVEKLQKALVQYKAAFGGCDICWGRGYTDPDYIYCTCPRGQKLQEVKGLLKNG